MNKQSKLVLGSICLFNFGAGVLVYFGLDWIGWTIIVSSVLLLFPLPKPQ